jgi:hypothetical protein
MRYLYFHPFILFWCIGCVGFRHYVAGVHLLFFGI